MDAVGKGEMMCRDVQMSVLSKDECGEGGIQRSDHVAGPKHRDKARCRCQAVVLVETQTWYARSGARKPTCAFDRPKMVTATMGHGNRSEKHPVL